MLLLRNQVQSQELDNFEDVHLDAYHRCANDKVDIYNNLSFSEFRRKTLCSFLTTLIIYKNHKRQIMSKLSPKHLVIHSLYLLLFFSYHLSITFIKYYRMLFWKLSFIIFLCLTSHDFTCHVRTQGKFLDEGHNIQLQITLYNYLFEEFQI